MRSTCTRLASVLAAVLLAGVALLGPGATAAGAGVIAPPQPGGLTGSVHFSCGRLDTPTVTVVVHNAYDAHFGVSVWADASVVLGNLAVPGHSTRSATFADPGWEDDTVWIDVLRIGGIAVASSAHTFDCEPGLGVALGASAQSGGIVALRHL